MLPSWRVYSCSHLLLFMHAYRIRTILLPFSPFCACQKEDLTQVCLHILRKNNRVLMINKSQLAMMIYHAEISHVLSQSSFIKFFIIG
jgi:hypothetical protein